jgi:hypothetical protein
MLPPAPSDSSIHQRRNKPSLLSGVSMHVLDASNTCVAFLHCKYPPAEPGALGIWPLEAATLNRNSIYLAGARNTPSRLHLDLLSNFSPTSENRCPLSIASPLIRSHDCPSQTSFRERCGSRSEVSAMGDRRKRQTYTASPAEPGGLPVMLVAIQGPNPSSGPERGFFKEAAISLSSDSGY